MTRFLRIAAGTTLLAGSFVAITAAPAGATVAATAAGTVVTVTLTGTENIGFGCNSAGKFVVSGTVTTPVITCGAVTSVHVNGDAGNQYIFGSSLDAPDFSAHPNLVAVLGGGADTTSETDRADSIDVGPGNDVVNLHAGGVTNTSVALGTGTDTMAVVGTEEANAMVATSTNASAKVVTTTTSGSSTSTATSVEGLQMIGRTRADTFASTAVTASSTVVTVLASGADGNDTFTAGATGMVMLGGDGTNVFYGGVGQDQFHTSSETDVIHKAGGGGDEVFDQYNGRSGGRTIDGNGLASYYDYLSNCDAQTRVRPGTAGGTRIVSALCRPGIVDVDSSFNQVEQLMGAGDSTSNRGLADVVTPGHTAVLVNGDTAHDDLVDVTVSTGTWVSSGTPATSFTVNPDDASLGNVSAQGVGSVSVHGPWANKNQGFAHRVTRDLMFRFLSQPDREAVAASLTSGVKTRPQVIAALMQTDEYRGLDVDRVFVQFLHRTSDSGGRTYWIDALRNGRTLRKFRAQLFGSNEYFANSYSDVTQFVKNAYFDVLGRLPDPSGQAYWVNKINTGTGRGAVANSFLVSTEARRAIVKDQFLRFVLRYPTTAEADQWVDTLAGPTGEQDLIAFLAASGGYYNAS